MKLTIRLFARARDLAGADSIDVELPSGGTVRDLTEGRETVALDYEAYPRMAEQKLAEIEAQTRARWPVGEIALVHRVGHLEVGEVSVAVAVSCPHRGQAFEACRHAIDRLKEIVPIWKKENWADGSTEWVHPA